MRESGWQLAQRAWWDSGRDWETASGRPPVPGTGQPDFDARTPYGAAASYAPDPYAASAYDSTPNGPGPHAPDAYRPDQYAPGAYVADRFRPDPWGAPHANGSYGTAPYSPDVFAPDPYALDPYAADEYPADEYPAGEYAPSVSAAAPPATGVYPSAGRGDADAPDADAEQHGPGSRASRFELLDSDATRIDFGMPYKPPAASSGTSPADPPAPRFPADRDDAHAEDADPHLTGSRASRFDREDSNAANIDFGMPYKPPAASQSQSPAALPSPRFHPADPHAGEPGVADREARAAHGPYAAAPRDYLRVPSARGFRPTDSYADDTGDGRYAANPPARGFGRADSYPDDTGDDPYAAGPPARGFRPADSFADDTGVGRYAAGPSARGFHLADQDAADGTADDRCAYHRDDRAGAVGAQSHRAGEALDSSYAAAPVLEDSRPGVGPWPVQSATSEPEQPRAAAGHASHKAATPDDDAGQRQDRDAAPRAGEDQPGAEARGRRQETRADRAAPGRPGPTGPGGDSQAPPALRYARQPPPLPRRTPQRRPGWDGEAFGREPGHPARDDRNDRLAGHPVRDDRSGRVRLPSTPASAPLSAAPFAPPGAEFASPGAEFASPGAEFAPPGAEFASPVGQFTNPAPQFTAPAALSESDELFRAWQGSVRDASSPRIRRQADQTARRHRVWQAAKIGVPAVVIVTVGAGALLMLTGRANEMLAERSSTGTARTGQAASTAASMILAGYPGGRGGVRVAAMWSASGTIVAVGMADGHPAIWRRSLNGGWPLVSAADLATMSGHLTSVAHGPAGWIAVGSVAASGVAQPMVYTSADGVTWQTVPSLTAMASSDAQFLGVAAGPGGYLVVGREGTGRQKFAQLWWSADLANWTAGGSSGYHNSLAIAAVADGDGFVAAGSQADCHTIWTSPDGTHWTTHDVTRPAGARTATLGYAAAGRGGRVVAAGFATNDAGAIPIVVTTDPGGVRVTQVVLPTGGIPGVVTGVTATAGGGFVAAGMIGPAKAQRAVTWTSADGLTWSAATPVSPATGTAITALTTSGGNVTGTLQRGMDPAVLTLPAP